MDLVNKPLLDPTKLARKALETYIKKGTITKISLEQDEFYQQKAGVFVSLKKEGVLRGCIGTFLPLRENLALEIIYNAIAAGTNDYRFRAVQAEELNSLCYSVDILSAPEEVQNLKKLDPIRYGIIVTAGNKKGLLLPNLKGIEKVDQQISIARQKAGISSQEKIMLERFEVIRFEGDE